MIHVAHRELARQVARESIVLLKNADGILPLQAKGKTIAVIGPNATMLESLEGNYNGQPTHPVLPLDGMESRFGADAKVLYAQGSSYVAGFPVMVPRTVLHTGNDIGLKGEYFNNAEWQGQPVLTRVDKQVDFDWDAASPAEGIPASRIQCPLERLHRCAGRGRLCLSNIAGTLLPLRRAWINTGFTWMTNWSWRRAVNLKDSTGHASFTMHFNDSAPHAIRVEYAHAAPMFGAGVHLDGSPRPAFCATRRSRLPGRQMWSWPS